MTDETPKNRRAEDSKIGSKAIIKGAFGLIPGGFGSFLTEGMNAVEERKRQREAAVTQEAIARLDIKIDELETKLTNDEELADLWDRATRAARSSRIAAKQFMFAAIMAGAVYADHNERLTANILIRLLDQLEEEHLQVMVAIEKRTVAIRPDTRPSHQGADREDLVQVLPHLGDALDIVISSLLSLNVIRSVWEGTHNAAAGLKRYALTSTGEALCRVLRAEGTPSDSGLL